MIKNYAIIGILLTTLAHSKVQAEQYISQATGTYSWEDPAAWVHGIVPPDDIRNKDSVIIRSEVVLMTSLGVKNGATLLINGTLVLFNPNGGIELENKGTIVINGLLSILPGINGEVNTLTNKTGDLVINGLLENIGAELVNDRDILVNSGGTLRNFGFKDAMDDLILRGDNGQVFNLYDFGSDLLGYVLDPGTILGGTGGPTIGVGPDSINYGAVIWTCFAGMLENDGDIINNGGTIDQSNCGGGIVSGSGSIEDVPSCTAASNLRTSGSNATTGMTFRWDEVPGAFGYIAAFKQAGASRYRITRPVNGGATSITFPRNFFPAGARVEWAVLTICEPGEIDMNLLTEAQATQVRIAQADLEEEQLPASAMALSLYPNPASEALIVESQGDAVKGTVSIFDLSGRLVLDQVIQLTASQPKQRLLLSDLEAGLYTVRIDNGDFVQQERLLITR
ncbi:MAG: T9SS type A sorting domain-containing protein [Bacteroidetes bacterium]|nr:T9SS type A sorting domain-containing protein [Bacteroidota bacterium]